MFKKIKEFFQTKAQPPAHWETMPCEDDEAPYWCAVHNYDPQMRFLHGATPLMVAVCHDDTRTGALVRQALAQPYADPMARDSFGRNAMYYACSFMARNYRAENPQSLDQCPEINVEPLRLLLESAPALKSAPLVIPTDLSEPLDSGIPNTPRAHISEYLDNVRQCLATDEAAVRRQDYSFVIKDRNRTVTTYHGGLFSGYTVTAHPEVPRAPRNIWEPYLRCGQAIAALLEEKNNPVLVAKPATEPS